MKLLHGLKLIAKGIADYLGESEILEHLMFGFAQTLVSQPKRMGYEKKPRLITIPTNPWYPLPIISSPTQVEGKVELHEAYRAGTHLDLRFRIEDRVYDYALPRTTRLPQRTGEVQLAIRRHNHSKGYFYTDSHVFPEGTYGAGRMRTVWRGHLDIIKSNPDSIEFYIPEGEFKGKYAIHNLKNGSILVRMKDSQLVHQDRMQFSSEAHKLEQAYANPNIVAEEKVDGANYILTFGEKENTLVSRRLSIEGTPINRADNIPQLKYLSGKVNERFRGRKIHVEVAVYNGTVSETSGILNQNPNNSRASQLTKPLVIYIWDIEGNTPYAQRRAVYKEIQKLSPRVDRRAWGSIKDRLVCIRFSNPKLIQVVESNEDVGLSPLEYSNLLKSQGREGVVLKDKTGLYYGDVWIKDKKVETYDLVVIGMNEGTGKYRESLGALIVQDPTTKAVSRVGTGFSDQERQLLWKYRNVLINKSRPIQIEVDCHEVTKKGVLRGPRFIKLVNPEDVQNRIQAKEIAVAQYKRAHKGS